MGGFPNEWIIVLRLGYSGADNASATRHGHGSGRHGRQDLLVVVWLTLRLDELDNLVDFVVRDKAALDTAGLAPVDLGEQHVAQTGELLGTHLVDDDARVDARGDVKGDAVGYVGLDKARHHVGAGALRGNDKVNTGGTARISARISCGAEKRAAFTSKMRDGGTHRLFGRAGHYWREHRGSAWRVYPRQCAGGVRRGGGQLHRAEKCDLVG